MSTSFKELIGEHSENKLRLGDVVDAKILDINFKKKLVLLDGGPDFKSETLISMDEFVGDALLEEEEGLTVDATPSEEMPGSVQGRLLDIAVGDSVSVMVEALDNGYGEAVLSREKARRGLAWEALQEAMDNKATVQGIINGKVRGGFTVDMGILKGFLPGSLVDAQYIEEINALTRRKFDFKVITLDYQRNNIVLSQGQVSRDALLKDLKKDQIIKGYLKSVTDYGAFINLGGIDGLLHNSDISWEKTTAREYFKSTDPKDPIEVLVLKVDRTQERPRISLGLKQLSEDPWVNLLDRYSVGMRLEKCRVTHVKEYGCFVEIQPGVEGLVHVSEMDWTNRNPSPHTLLQKIQDEEGRIDVMILGIEVDIEANRRRLSLGIKQCLENPWTAFAERYQEGDVTKGTVRSVTDLGLFIQLEGNIDGLVHHSEISESYSGEEATRQFKKGQDIEVVVLSIDPDKERIALSVRQLDFAREGASAPDSNDQDLATESKAENSPDDVEASSDDKRNSRAEYDIANAAGSDGLPHSGTVGSINGKENVGEAADEGESNY